MLIVSLPGVVPSTDFLKSSGVKLSSRGDVIVDKVSKWFIIVPNRFLFGICKENTSFVSQDKEWVAFCSKGMYMSCFLSTLNRL